jgi:elongator complex protein 3
LNNQLQKQLVRVPLELYEQLLHFNKINAKKIQQLLRQFPKNNNSLYARDELLRDYEYYSKAALIEYRKDVADELRLKPTRTISGVTPVSLLTKPYPCPGKCIFCPNDLNMPKSYITSEPGAQRAARNAFDPYLQTYNRLLALQNIGHTVEKVELIILGGTWSSYPLNYRIWFLTRCFQALNDFPNKDDRPHKKTLLPEDLQMRLAKNYNAEVEILDDAPNDISWQDLFLAQTQNESAKCRNVGLVIETRPDVVNRIEVINLREMGVTKIQMGIQSLDDDILKANKRGTSEEIIKNAVALCRSAGLKIHLHWMPNLYKATVTSDKNDYLKIWELLQPDELKIYPTSVIKGTPLFDLYSKGEYSPYTTEQLNDLLKFCLTHTPTYCRLSRIIRDIPSNQIAAGNKVTNLRQTIEQALIAQETPCRCIRCREIRGKKVAVEDLKLNILPFETAIGKEYFISYDAKTQDKLAGFLRLFLSDSINNFPPISPELNNAAIIREVHVYGKALGIGEVSGNKPQHLGLGKKMIAEAEKIANKMGFNKICIISAIGTRAYYAKLGYSLEGTYMTKILS